jgi:RNA polymerase sigma-70 factor, ECF subfamily
LSEREPTSAEIFSAYRDRIHRYIARVVHDPGAAEDLTQETFLRAHRDLTSLKDPGALASWLYRIATRVCYDRFRQRPERRGDARRGAGPDETELPADTPGSDEVAEQREMGACVQTVVDELPDTYRAVILLSEARDLSNREIADQLGCSVDTVKIRLHRARAKLRSTLEARCELSQDGRGALVCEPRERSSVSRAI